VPTAFKHDDFVGKKLKLAIAAAVAAAQFHTGEQGGTFGIRGPTGNVGGGTGPGTGFLIFMMSAARQAAHVPPHSTCAHGGNSEMTPPMHDAQHPKSVPQSLQTIARFTRQAEHPTHAAICQNLPLGSILVTGFPLTYA